MSYEMTEGGKAAYQALEWAFEDPASRVGTSQQRIAELAAAYTDPKSAAEIGDAATMLSRLAGSLQPVARTISDQMPSTIREQMG